MRGSTIIVALAFANLGAVAGDVSAFAQSRDSCPPTGFESQIDTSGQNEGAAAGPLLNQGKVHLEKKRYACAIISLTKAVRMGTRLREAHFNLGLAYHASGNFDRAIEKYDEVIKLRDTYPEAHSKRVRAYQDRARFYQDKGDLARAIADLKTAQGFDKGNAAIRERLEQAEAALRAKQGGNACGEMPGGNLIDACTQAILSKKLVGQALASAHFARGSAYHDIGDRVHAVEDLSEALRQTSEYTPALVRRARVYQDQDEIGKAITDYRVALRLDPNHEETRKGLERALRDKNLAETSCEQDLTAVGVAACTRLTKFATHNSHELAAIYNKRGLNFSKQQKHNEALSAFNEAIHLDSSYADAIANRGDAFAAMNRPDQAIDDYTSVIAVKPAEPGWYIKRAKAYQANSKNEQAVSDYRKAVELDPKNDFFPLYALGFLYLDKSDYESAVQYLGRAAERNPKDDKVQSALAKARTALAAKLELDRKACEQSSGDAVLGAMKARTLGMSREARTISQPSAARRASAFGRRGE